MTIERLYQKMCERFLTVPKAGHKSSKLKVQSAKLWNRCAMFSILSAPQHFDFLLLRNNALTQKKYQREACASARPFEFGYCVAIALKQKEKKHWMRIVRFWILRKLAGKNVRKVKGWACDGLVNGAQ